MRRRSGTSDEKVKAQRRKAATPKRRKGPKAARRRGSAAAGQETKVAFLIRELSQAVEQQAATAKVLQIISSSTFDLQTVLNALVEAGMHLCEADVAAIWRPENGVLKLAATSGMSNEFVEFAKQNPIMPGRGTVSGRVVLEGKAVHLPDVLADTEFTGIGYQSSGKYRSNLGVPLLRKGQTIGAFLVARRGVRPFTEKQIKLIETFAEQAVIAIENVRLFEAEQQRTRELTESLDQQTAMSEVLEGYQPALPAISGQCLSTMLEKAVSPSAKPRFGDIFSLGRRRLAPRREPQYTACLCRRTKAVTVSPRPGPPGTSMSGAMLATKSVVHVADLAAEQPYIERSNPAYVAAVELGGVRTLLLVPMLKAVAYSQCR